MQRSPRAVGEYEFSEHNPFLGDPAALEKGKDLFKRGLLTEAALALEAEVRHPGWTFRVQMGATCVPLRCAVDCGQLASIWQGWRGR